MYICLIILSPHDKVSNKHFVSTVHGSSPKQLIHECQNGFKKGNSALENNSFVKVIS